MFLFAQSSQFGVRSKICYTPKTSVFGRTNILPKTIRNTIFYSIVFSIFNNTQFKMVGGGNSFDILKIFSELKDKI